MKPEEHPKIWNVCKNLGNPRVLPVGIIAFFGAFMMAVMYIEFNYPEYSEFLLSLSTIFMNFFMIIAIAISLLFGILIISSNLIFFFTKEEKNKLALFFVFGNWLNMVAAGLFAFVITDAKDIFELIHYIPFIVITFICVMVGSYFVYQYR